MPYQSQKNERYRALGIMSGTSLDGLDLCRCDFMLRDNKWNYSILKAITIDYSQEIKDKLINAYTLSGKDLAELNAWYGNWIGERVNDFKTNISEPIDLIGSHGHTVFHNPKAGYTTQIGSGAHIAARAGIPCICDFRSGDVARGGQGAPLVPVGDELLFSEFDICLNIGGIANLSYTTDNGREAFDICPANMALNYLSNKLNKPFDDEGIEGKKGIINQNLLNKLNGINFYHKKGAKSMGREWFEKEFKPHIDSSYLNTNDTLRTIYDHIAIQISDSLHVKPQGNVLVTGGGAKNVFLIDLIRKKCDNVITVPNSILIDFKESLIFGLLSVLYTRRLPSSLSSVTGATTSSIGGCLYY
jgi:anhydro-N-acetylmuramic acid kinase